LHRRDVDPAEHGQDAVPVDRQPAGVVAHYAQPVEVAAVEAVELRLERRLDGADLEHDDVAREVGVERHAQALVGDRAGRVDVGDHRQRVDTGVGAARGVDRAVLARQARERRLDGALHRALPGGLPLPALEAGAVVLQEQPDAPARAQAAVPRAAGSSPGVRAARGVRRVTRPSHGTRTVPTPPISRYLRNEATGARLTSSGRSAELPSSAPKTSTSASALSATLPATGPLVSCLISSGPTAKAARPPSSRSEFAVGASRCSPKGSTRPRRTAPGRPRVTSRRWSHSATPAVARPNASPPATSMGRCTPR